MLEYEKKLLRNNLTKIEKFKLAVAMAQTLIDNNIINVERYKSKDKRDDLIADAIKIAYLGISEGIKDVDNISDISDD
jgi:hypothetical protein